jgi:transcriptional regulator with XRE-family HTH domain
MIPNSRLKKVRRQLKLSQADLAERSGVSLGSLKRFENSGKISLDAISG